MKLVEILTDLGVWQPFHPLKAVPLCTKISISHLLARSLALSLYAFVLICVAGMYGLELVVSILKDEIDRAFALPELFCVTLLLLGLWGQFWEQLGEVHLVGREFNKLLFRTKLEMMLLYTVVFPCCAFYQLQHCFLLALAVETLGSHRLSRLQIILTASEISDQIAPFFLLRPTWVHKPDYLGSAPSPDVDYMSLLNFSELDESWSGSPSQSVWTRRRNTQIEMNLAVRPATEWQCIFISLQQNLGGICPLGLLTLAYLNPWMVSPRDYRVWASTPWLRRWKDSERIRSGQGCVVRVEILSAFPGVASIAAATSVSASGVAQEPIAVIRDLSEIRVNCHNHWLDPSNRDYLKNLATLLADQNELDALYSSPPT